MMRHRTTVAPSRPDQVEEVVADRGTPRLPASRPGSRGRRRRMNWSAYVYLLPAVALVGGIAYYSLGYTMWLSTYDWDGLSPDRTEVGLGNYVQAIHDPVFWQTLWHSAVFGLVIPIQMVIGLAAAVLLHSRVWFRSLYKIVIFLPIILAPAIVAPVFRQMLDANGTLNGLLRAVGLGWLAHSWLADTHLALYALMAITVWQSTGFSFVLYYAGITQIDPSIYEAARMDGAGNWRTIRHIVVPMLRGTHKTLVVLGVIGVLKTFDTVFLVTGGGPVHSSELLTTYIYRVTIGDFHAGYGAALSVVLLVLSLAFTVWRMRRYRLAAGEETVNA